MNDIEWSEEYSVGVEKLDEQHQLIIVYINKLINRHDISVRSEEFHEILHALNEYTKLHSSYEELLLTSSGYKNYKHHSDEHWKYRQLILDVMAETLNGNQETVDKAIKVLIAWFHEHVLVEDMKYKSFFEEKGIM